MKKQNLVIGSILLVGAAFVAKIIGAFFKIPLANILGGIGMSYFSSAYAIFLPVYAVAVIGLSTAVSKVVAENVAFRRFKNVRKIKRIALFSFGFVGLCFSFLIIITASPFSKYIIENENALPAIFAVAPCIFLGAIMSVYRGYYEGLHNMTPTAISLVLEAIAKLCLGLLFAILLQNYALEQFSLNGEVFGYNFLSEEAMSEAILPYVAAASVLGISASSLVGLLYLMLKNVITGDKITKEMIDEDKTTDKNKDIIKELFFLVVPVAIGSLVTNLTSLIDLGTITKFLNDGIASAPNYFANEFEEVLGNEVDLTTLSNFIYGSFTGLAVTIFNLIPSMMGMFGKGVIPKISEAYALKDEKKINSNVSKVLFLSSLLAFPAGIGIALLSEQILQFLFGSRVAEVAVSVSPLFYLGFATIFLAITIPIFSIFQGIGRADLPVKIMFVGIIIKLVGNIGLMSVKEINIDGAAISTLICYFAIFFISIYNLKKLTKVKLDYKLILLKPLFSGLFCGFSAYLTYSLLQEYVRNLFLLPLSIGVGGLFYLISLYLMNVIDKKGLKSRLF